MRNEFDQFRVDGLVDAGTEGLVGHYLGDGDLLADLRVVRDGLDDGPGADDSRQSSMAASQQDTSRSSPWICGS